MNADNNSISKEETKSTKLQNTLAVNNENGENESISKASDITRVQ